MTKTDASTVLVCGGRNYTFRRRVFEVLDEYAGMTHLVHGAAGGADSLAAAWGLARRVHRIAAFPATWQLHGRAAGPIRNQAMLVETAPGLVVAFPGGAGTADMVARAKAAGVPVLEVDDE